MSSGHHPLLERDAERAALRALIARAAAGQGGAAVICGPAGIGKTRLLAESSSASEEFGLNCLNAAGSELERGFAFGAVQQLFEHTLMALSDAARADVFRGAAGHAEAAFPALGARQGPPPEATHAVLHGLYWLTVNLAARKPLLVSVDDAHWLDQPSLRWLTYLSHRLDDLPICLIVGTRLIEPGADHDALHELISRGHARALTPSPLGVSAVLRLLESRLGADTDRDFAESCHRATGGNPFYVSELIAELARRGLEPTRANVSKVSAVTPESVVQSVASRLRRIPAEARRLAHAAAVLTDADGRELAGRLGGLDSTRVADAAEALANAGIFDARHLGFVHPLLRSAVYANMRPAERDELHVQAAQALLAAKAPPERAAAHLLASHPRHSDWSLDVLMGAASSARLRAAPDAAARYLQRALQEDPAATRRGDILRQLGHSLLAAEGLTGLSYLCEAREVAPDARTESAISLELGLALFTLGRFPEAAEILGAALDHARRHHLESESVLQAHLAGVAVLDLHVVERLGGLSGVAELAARSGYTGGLAQATLGWIEVASRPRADQGARLAHAALADSRLASAQDLLGLAAAAFALLASDQLLRAKEIWDQVVSTARSRGALATLRLALAHRAIVHDRLGDLRALEADSREVIDWALELETPLAAYATALPWVTFPLVDALIERGELEEANEWTTTSMPEGDLPPVLGYSFLLETLGRLRIAQGRHRDAIALLRECGRRLDAWGIVNPGFVPWRSTYALALAAVGEHAKAVEMCAEEVNLARRFAVPRALGVALTRAGRLSTGQHQLDSLRESTLVLEATPAMLARAYSWFEYGAALRATTEQADAREALRRSLDLASRCGASELANRAQHELVAAGAKPRRAAISGARALTPTEARVARLATTGLTNREIAEALFVTEKTVEGHLAHAFRKLDIRSRTQLPDLIEQD